MTTDFKINNNPVQNPGKYGEGKFYIIPTYKFADNATLQNGDTLTYTVPSVFRVEQSGPVEIKAGDNVTTVASLTTNPANNTATITITNAEYYARLNENKSLTALFTAVWADSTPKNIEQTFDLPGAGEYKLMRIVPDVDPTGYTKWGNQDRNNPELVNWRIRINRYAKPGIVNAMVKDTIPEGQEVVPDSFSGYYFTDWEAAQNGGTAGGRVAYTGGEVNIEDDNHFTITPSNGGSLDGRGLLIIFQTRITAPVDLVTKKVFNNYRFTSATHSEDVEGFAALTTTDGVGTGARPDEIIFEVNKTLNGRSLNQGEFSFELVDSTNQVVATATNDENGVVKFKKMKFRTAGNFTYKIREVNNNLPGVTYDKNIITATVTVTDNGGAKTAAVTYTKPGFTNTYKAASVTKVLKATKALVGKNLVDDQFTFELVNKETGQVTQTAKSKADGTVTFPAETYTAVGNYTYIIREKNDGSKGYTYDTKAPEVTVAVTDNGQGQLVATETYAAPAEFTNNYQALSTTAAFSFTKKLTGRAQKAGEFSFDLTAPEAKDNQTKATADENGTINFDPITYTQTGVYEYTVKEQNGKLGGITYDEKAYKIKVTVTDNAGQLEAAVEYPDGQEITNTYQAKSVSKVLKANKALTGANLADDQFTFELVNKATDKVVQTAKNKADGTVTFPAETYTEVGNHTYIIREKNDGSKGYTYDAKNVEVTVAVTDNGQGQLVATETYAAPAEFTNNYQALSTSAVISVTKALTGRPLKAGEFSFDLIEEGATSAAQTKANAENGSVAFDAITYTKPGTYKYTVKEQAGTVAGVTYSTQVLNVTVKVTDNAGQLEATVEYPDGQTITNAYKAAAADVTIKAKKVLKGKTLVANAFTFELVDASTNKVVDTAKNDANGDITFKAQSLSSAGAYTYSVREKLDANDKGMTYDSSNILVHVRVTDNLAGQLEATVTPDKELTFTNSYKPLDQNVTLMATKRMEGRALQANEFNFVLKDADGKELQRVANDATGKVSFEPITYSAVGTYTYTIAEVSGDAKGVTYDAKEVKVTVEVKDDNGQLVATPSYEQEPVFTNRYAAASTKQALSVKKVLEGRALEAGEFEFELLDEQGTKLASAKNDAEGNVTFEEQTYSKVGTSKYRIQEVNNGLKNVTYDTKVVEATVEVVDKQAQLTPSVTYTNDATFTNTYKAVDPGQPSFSVDAMKELEGREMKADEFQFNLLDSNGNLVATAKNDASGKIHLEHTITNPSEGTFTYKVVEKDLGDKEITYDKTVHELSVTVSKDSEGKFQAKVDSAKSIVFKNTYKPVKEEKKLPKTGEAQVIWLTALASMMVMGAIAVLLLDKKARSQATLLVVGKA